MTRTKLIIIISSIILFFAALGVFFTVQKDEQSNQITQNQPQSFDFIKEDEIREDVESFGSLGLSKLKVITYGGYTDIKTYTQNSKEYALIRNPKITGDLELISSDTFGDYYLAEDNNGDKILYTEGASDGKFGYTDRGEVSDELIREKIPSAEYYAAYPISELAAKSGFKIFGNEGSVNNYLNTKYLKITNANNNRQVIVEIDARNYIEDTILISEATRKALLVDNGVLGSFDLEIVDKENNTLGVVRL